MQGEWPGFGEYEACTKEELIAKMREAMKTYVMTPSTEDDPTPVIVTKLEQDVYTGGSTNGPETLGTGENEVGLGKESA